MAQGLSGSESLLFRGRVTLTHILYFCLSPLRLHRPPPILSPSLTSLLIALS